MVQLRVPLGESATSGWVRKDKGGSFSVGQSLGLGTLATNT